MFQDALDVPKDCKKKQDTRKRKYLVKQTYSFFIIIPLLSLVEFVKSLFETR